MTKREQTNVHLDQSYWGIVKRQFKKNRLAVWSLRVVYLILFIALFADFIANEKPIYCKYEGGSYFPVFKEYAVNLGLSNWQPQFQNVDWDQLEFDFALWPLVPYLPSNNNLMDKFLSPFDKQNARSVRWKHWLGTDHIGRDVLAGMIHGSRIAVAVGVIAMGISTVIGVALGSMAGYFGDDRFKITRSSAIFNLLFLPFAFFYGFSTRSYVLADSFATSYAGFFFQLVISLAIFIALMGVANLLAWPVKKISWFGQRTSVPIDILVSRLVEVVVSIPSLLLILSFIAITKPSIFLVMAIIGLTGWTGIARFIRGEILRVRNLEYIEAAQALGYSEARIIFKHAIPNSLTPVLISVAFGIASAILIESTLSFLGIGVPAETVTWGKLLSVARSYPEAWWLAIFPGFAIFLTVTIYNLLGEGLTDALDPRLKR